jgi:Alginate export
MRSRSHEPGNAQRWSRASWLAGVLVAGAVPALQAQDLTIYQDDRFSIRPTLTVESAYYNNDNSWLGRSDSILGAKSDDWLDGGITPGLEMSALAGDSSRFVLRVSGVGTLTRVGLDAAGSNFDPRKPDDFTLEDWYLKWTSGDLIPGLGRDGLQLSVGGQRYQVGSGFLFWDGSSDGGPRGAFWLAPRKAFEFAAVGKVSAGPFSGQLAYLTPNDSPGSDTDVGTVDLQYSFGDFGSVAGGFTHIFSSDNLLRDGMSVWDARFNLTPFEGLRSLNLLGEFAYESNGGITPFETQPALETDVSAYGLYGELGYSFDTTPWTPYLSYRYSFFSGDEPGADQIEAFDPLFYGASDWSTWYVGEVLGEYATTNQNQKAHTLRLRANPTESITLTSLFIDFSLDDVATVIQSRVEPRAADVTEKHLGNEFDLIVDWAATEHISFSGVAAFFFPGAGAEQFVRADETWATYLIYTKVAF